MPDGAARLAEAIGRVDKLAGHPGATRAPAEIPADDRPWAWDLAGLIPVEDLRELGAHGVLCAQVPERFGGLGLGSRENGELTAHTGALCSSLRSVMTSQGMAAWAVQRLGDQGQRRRYLSALTSGALAAVGFSEPGAGSDLSGIATRLRPAAADAASAGPRELILDGGKIWVTAAHYADLLVVFAQYEDGAAAVVVPADAPGVRVERVADPLGCRAAGHAYVYFDGVRLTEADVLGGSPQSLPLLVTTALTYGRFSVAWGCVGILRGCLRAASAHARTREQSGTSLDQHQLVAAHLAELYVAEQAASRSCEHASARWDEGATDVAVATVLAKHTSARLAAQGASSAVQVLASAGSRDGHLVARAYRDAKLMEIIEGSNEICTLVLARHAAHLTD